MVDIHGFWTVQDARKIANNPAELKKWRKQNGYTNVAGQCRFCLEIFGRLSIRPHIRQCRPSENNEDTDVAGDINLASVTQQVENNSQTSPQSGIMKWLAQKSNSTYFNQTF